MLFLPVRTCSSILANGKICDAFSIYSPILVSGSTMISISVDNLLGLGSSRLVPPLNVNSNPTCTRPNANMKPQSILRGYFEK